MPDSLPNLRIWLVHDWLTGMRGGERVLLELVRMFPQAKIATLIHIKGSTDPEIEQRVERVSWLNALPYIARTYRNLLPLFPGAIRKIYLTDCDLVISSNHCVAKGIQIPKGAKHLCYSHGFLRYVWDMEEAYATTWPKRTALRMFQPSLRRFDVQNEHVDQFIANSNHEVARIRKFYNRDSNVVYPGTDTDWYVPNDQPPMPNDQAFYLVVAKLVPFKRIDLVVEAFAPGGPLNGRRLFILGDGPDLARLQHQAGTALNKTIEFHGWADREKVRWHYQNCRALLFPGEEHFGMTAVECQSCARPVIAYRSGGVCETVTEGKTGLFFEEQTPTALSEAVKRFESADISFDAKVIRENALRFTWTRFRNGMETAVTSLIGS